MIDWSGVISDDEKVAYATNCRMLKHYGLPPVDYSTWKQHSLGGSWKGFFAARGLHDLDALANLFEKCFEEVAKDGVKPKCYPTARPFLESIREGRQIFVISSHNQRFLNTEVEEYGLRSLIDATYGSVHDKTMTFRQVMAGRGLHPDDCVYIADMSYDVQYARRAGIMPVSVASGYHSRETLLAAEPDILVDSLDDLQRLYAA